MLIPLVYVSLGQAVTLSRSLHRSRWRERGLGAQTCWYRRPVLRHEPAQLLRGLRWRRRRAGDPAAPHRVLPLQGARSAGSSAQMALVKTTK